jgi:hypothetical protein
MHYSAKELWTEKQRCDTFFLLTVSHLLAAKPSKIITKYWMVNAMDIQNSGGRDTFWQAYQACIEENRVPPDRSLFYVKWAKAFAFFVSDKPLQDRSSKDIDRFLDDLRKRQGIQTCQVRQAERSLKILYEVFLPSYSPEKYTPIPADPKLQNDAQEAVDGTNGFRDRVIPGEVERRFMIYTHVLNKPGFSVKSPADI